MALNSTDISTDAADAVAACQNLGRDLTSYIKDEPVKSLAIATTAGFVFGGGLNSRVGLAMITMGMRMALRGFCGYALAGVMTGRNRHEGGQHRVDLRMP